MPTDRPQAAERSTDGVGGVPPAPAPGHSAGHASLPPPVAAPGRRRGPPTHADRCRCPCRQSRSSCPATGLTRRPSAGGPAARGARPDRTAARDRARGAAAAGVLARGCRAGCRTLAPRRGADPRSRAGHGPAGWAVGLAAGRPAPGPAGLRPAGAPVRSRPPRSRPRRRAGRPGARRRSRRRRLRRRARRSRCRLRAARRRPAHHLRAAGRGDPAWSRRCPRLRPRAPGGRPRRLPLARLPALGPAPGRGLLGPALAAPPRPGPPPAAGRSAGRPWSPVAARPRPGELSRPRACG